MLYIYFVVLYIYKRKDRFYLITLYSFHNRVQYNYDVKFIYKRMTKRSMREFIVLCACEEVKVQRFIMCFSAVIHLFHFDRI